MENNSSCNAVGARRGGRNSTIMAHGFNPSIRFEARDDLVASRLVSPAAGVRDEALRRLAVEIAGMLAVSCVPQRTYDVRKAGATVVQPVDAADGTARLLVPAAAQGANTECIVLE